jgi:hypothetical protein
MVVVPATPALLAKVAGGCADEALVRACCCIVAQPCWPSLARQPYQHALVQHNLHVYALPACICMTPAFPTLRGYR